MKKGKKLNKWEAMACLILAPTMVLMVILLFFVPPVLDQYDWVRPEDKDKAVENLSLMIVDGVLGQTDYTVKGPDGELIKLRRIARDQEFAVTIDPNAKESGSVLTMAQAQDLLEPLWNLVASDGDWHMVYISLDVPRLFNEQLSMQRRVNMTMSLSTGKITAVKETFVGTTDLGAVFVQGHDRELKQSFHISILLVP